MIITEKIRAEQLTALHTFIISDENKFKCGKSECYYAHLKSVQSCDNKNEHLPHYKVTIEIRSFQTISNNLENIEKCYQNEAKTPRKVLLALMQAIGLFPDEE